MEPTFRRGKNRKNHIQKKAKGQEKGRKVDKVAGDNCR